jgi:ElaB/YqjD/DUF883 family membrane-anchored ribosome-binding protein
MGEVAHDRLRKKAFRMSKRRRPDVEMLRNFRLSEVQRLLRHRVGRHLPDDDAGREYLHELLLIASLRIISPATLMWNLAGKWAPWMSDAERDQMIELIERTPPRQRYRTPDALGKELNLTNAERDLLAIRQIAPVDFTKAERAARSMLRKRERDKLRRAQARRQAGARSRADYLAANQLSRKQPWKSAGISRATWYRQQRHQAERETTPSPHKLLIDVATNQSHQNKLPSPKC